MAVSIVAMHLRSIPDTHCLVLLLTVAGQLLIGNDGSCMAIAVALDRTIVLQPSFIVIRPLMIMALVTTATVITKNKNDKQLKLVLLFA